MPGSNEEITSGMTMKPHKRRIRYPRTSLFNAIYFYDPPYNKWHREITPLLRKVERARDDRSFILAANLVIENRLDSLLGALLPGYPRLLGSGGLHFAQKISVARSLRLFPDRIFDLADFFRAVRNDFAHDLRYEYLARMKQSRKGKLQHLKTLFPESARVTTVRKVMENLFLHCALDLRLQQMNAELFRYVIADPGFEKLVNEMFPSFQKRKEGLH